MYAYQAHNLLDVTRSPSAAIQTRPHSHFAAASVNGMTDIRSWDADEGQHLLSELQTHCAAINDCGAQLLENMTALIPDSPSGTEWLGTLAAEMHGIAQATHTVTAQVAQYGDTMTLLDHYDASQIRGTNS